MNKQDREFLNSEAKMIHESDLRFAQVLASIETAYSKGKKSAERATKNLNKVTGE